MAGPFLVERGINPSPEGVGPALLMRLLAELPGSVPTYFRHLADQPKMAEALWATRLIFSQTSEACRWSSSR